MTSTTQTAGILSSPLLRLFPFSPPLPPPPPLLLLLFLLLLDVFGIASASICKAGLCTREQYCCGDGKCCDNVYSLWYLWWVEGYFWNIYFQLQPVRHPVTSSTVPVYTFGSPFPGQGPLKPRKNPPDVCLLITACFSGHFTRLLQTSVAPFEPYY